MFIFGDVIYEGKLFERCIIFGFMANDYITCFTPKGELMMIKWEAVKPNYKILEGFEFNYMNHKDIEINFYIRQPVDK